MALNVTPTMDAFRRTLFQPRNPAQGVRHRRWYFSRGVVERNETKDLFHVCPGCGLFYARGGYPVGGSSRNVDEERMGDEGIRHRIPLVFIDGACRNNGNGRRVQTAGLGIAFGVGDEDKLSITVDETIDPSGTRTSQRAELLAAVEAVIVLINHHLANYDGESKHETRVIATDSEYVVKGITEWYPEWRQNGWKDPRGRTPVNLDLFRRLDFFVKLLEKRGVDVGFLHVLREYNALADSLANEGAKRA